MKFDSWWAVDVNALVNEALRRFIQWHVDRTPNLPIERRKLYHSTIAAQFLVAKEECFSHDYQLFSSMS